MNVRANKHLLLWSSLATVALLGSAAFEENVQQEWRVLQKEYRDLLPPADAAEFAVQLRQVVVPDLHATDRCVTCHVGMAAGGVALAGHAVFGAHPDVVHDPSEYGCTVCHAGQGRATEKGAAHGTIPHWPEPMLPKRFSYAGCGVCHTHLAVPSEAKLQRGLALVERNDCLACHKLDGRGGTLRPGAAGGMEGPNLSTVGSRGYDPQWYETHLQRAMADETNWQQSFARLPTEDRDTIEEFLASRVGAPQLIQAKAMFHSLGCRGCHKIGGVGGDDGPELDAIGNRDPGQINFTHVPEPHTVASWIAEHFRAPSTVTPGSQMPELGLTEAQIEELTFYMMSLRHGSFPEAYWPNDRIASVRQHAREFSTDGATLYGTFCAACHGRKGQGMRYAGMDAFPAIGSADFLRLADDAFLEAVVRHGRVGRRMPAWGEATGGLRIEEIEAIVDFLRDLAGGVQSERDPRPRRWVTADAQQGAALYKRYCSSCHGTEGEGGEGTALGDAVFLQHATDTYLVETVTRGRGGTGMEAFSQASVVRPTLSSHEIESIIAYIRTWEVQP